MTDPETLPPGPLLGLDLGRRRVGLAASGLFEIVHPLGYLEAEPKKAFLKELKRIAQDRSCVGIVVGLPLNMNGSEGPAAHWARSLGQEIQKACGLPVAFFDESLTSWEAQNKLDQTGRKRHKQKERLDALAAAQILDDFLADRKSRTGPPAQAGEEGPAEGAP